MRSVGLRMPDPDRTSMDEVDRIIIGILAANPRIPYTKIATKLKERDHDMSAEGVRKRVDKLLERTTPFFLIAPSEHDWNLIRFAITVADKPGAEDAVMDALSGRDFWFLGQGFGTYDIYAVANAPSNAAVNDLINQVRGLETVKDLTYSIETERRVDIDNYYPVSREQ